MIHELLRMQSSGRFSTVEATKESWSWSIPRTFARVVMCIILVSTVNAFVLQTQVQRKAIRSNGLNSMPQSMPASALNDASEVVPSDSNSQDVAPTPAGWTDSNQLAALKETIDIVSVVESYGLDKFQRKSATRATAVCPFHDDRNPSLSIDGTRRLYKCFACGAGGDAFHFVRQFSKLQGQSMTFFEAIRHVSREFGDGSIAAASGSWSNSRLSDEERQQIQQKKDRLLLANAAAATFYADNLKKPFAGSARQHLLSRKLTASSVRAFALGYAPDAYYGNRLSGESWGDGSLANHLHSLNFTNEEMVEAGLAIRPKKRDNDKSIFEQVDGQNTTNENADDVMDRFRGRLVVPIFDSSGRNILGFGGRVLESDQRFESPKYLNSPETVIFEKKRILFGQNLAETAIRSNSNLPLLVVEGYMDAISLWTAGFKNVVASMGTAISVEQLAAAARLCSIGCGRVIFCLDSDQAGLTAVSRLCQNGMLIEVTSKNTVTFQVASLPDGVKDPADFIEACAQRDLAGVSTSDLFVREVVDTAKDWTDWFIQQLLSDYNPGSPRGGTGSFGDIFNRIADFLASSLESADRTKRAFEVADSLALLMARDSNKTELSIAVRTQLESDLIDTSARIARAKEATQRRFEAADVGSVQNSQIVSSALSTGKGPLSLSIDDDRMGKLSRKARTNATRVVSRDRRDFDSSLLELGDPSKKATGINTRYRTQMKRRGSKSSGSEMVLPSLTPHFSGFDFFHKSDVEWLSEGADKGKSMRHRLALGQSTQLSKKERDSDYLSNPEALQNKLVFFNSNEYHGHRFLTEDAATAGYSIRPIKRDPSIFTKGIGSLVVQDTQRRRVAAEDALLKVMVRDAVARTTIENVIEAKIAVNSAAVVEWTSSEKAWLFDKLITGEVPSSIQSSTDLRNFLSGLLDLPGGAFSPVIDDGGQELEGKECLALPHQSGPLDPFFVDEDAAIEPSTETGDHVALLAQDLFGSLLFAVTADKATRIRQELTKVAPALKADDVGSGDEDIEESPAWQLPDSSQANALQASGVDPKQAQLVRELQGTMRTLHTLSESNKRMSSRLMNKGGIMNRNDDEALQADLAARLDEHLAQMDPMEAPESDELYHASNNEPYEDALERMDREWGVWARDDVTSANVPETTVSSTTAPPPNALDSRVSDTARESLEEALARMDREWAAWIDDEDN